MTEHKHHDTAESRGDLTPPDVKPPAKPKPHGASPVELATVAGPMLAGYLQMKAGSGTLTFTPRDIGVAAWAVAMADAILSAAAQAVKDGILPDQPPVSLV